MKTYLIYIFAIFITSYSYSQEMKIEVDSKSGCIKFQQKHDNRIYLESSYDNETFNMIIDSYSWFSSLPKDWVVDKWKFKKTPYIYTTRDFNNKRQKVRLRLMENISIASTFTATNFYINPKKTLDDFDIGILGIDFLNDLNWQFNFKSENLCFDEKPFNMSNISIKNEFKKTEFPWLKLQIDDIEHKLTIDLGASSEISIPAESKLGEWLIKHYNLSPKSVKSGGANGLDLNDIQYNVFLDSIFIEGTLIQNVNIKISKNTKVSFIGCDLLKRGVLYLNYHNENKDIGLVGFELND
jgi:hypothetical protein